MQIDRTKDLAARVKELMDQGTDFLKASHIVFKEYAVPESSRGFYINRIPSAISLM